MLKFSHFITDIISSQNPLPSSSANVSICPSLLAAEQPLTGEYPSCEQYELLFDAKQLIYRNLSLVFEFEWRRSWSAKTITDLFRNLKFIYY